MTAGRWPWKSGTAKNRVTTYLPNEPALKKDDAQVQFLSHIVVFVLRESSRNE